MNITSIKQWFVKALPTPTDKNRAVQLGCHFEEVSEMLAAIAPGQGEDTPAKLAYFYKKECHGVNLDEPDRKELLDALCDQIVTAIGVAHMFGLDIERGLIEVDRSNWSKFVDGEPQFDANGKIAKPPTFSPAKLDGMY